MFSIDMITLNYHVPDINYCYYLPENGILCDRKNVWHFQKTLKIVKNQKMNLYYNLFTNIYQKLILTK